MTAIGGGRLKTMDKRIDEIQRDEDEYFVELKLGYCLDLGTPMDFQHCFGARTKAEIREQMKMVRRCKCEGCRRKGGE